MARCFSERCNCSFIGDHLTSPLDDTGKVPGIGYERWEQSQSGSGKSFSVVMGSVVSVVPIFEPPLSAFDRNQPVACRVAEDVFKRQSIGMQIRGKELSQPHSQQSPALLQNQFEFLYAGCTIYVVRHILWIIFNQPLERGLQHFYATSEVFGVYRQRSASGGVRLCLRW